MEIITELARGAETEAVRLGAARTLLQHASFGKTREISERYVRTMLANSLNSHTDG